MDPRTEAPAAVAREADGLSATACRQRMAVRMTQSAALSEFGPLLVTAVVSVAGTYLATRWKVRRDLEARYDANLRDLRLKVYKKLWASTGLLAAFARPGYPTHAQLDELTNQLRAWYFDEGGLYLSTRTRDAYFRLQRALRTLINSDRWKDERLTELDPQSFEHLREIGSRLRSQMTYDVGTRQPFSLSRKGSKSDPSGPPADDPGDRAGS
jgi:hypothetical protein